MGNILESIAWKALWVLRTLCHKATWYAKALDNRGYTLVLILNPKMMRNPNAYLYLKLGAVCYLVFFAGMCSCIAQY